jgi:integrase
MAMTPTKHAGIEKVGTNTYSIRARATCPRSGRRKEVERVRECTLTEARALQHEWRLELEKSLVVEKAARVRLRDFAASWLDGRIAAGKLKPSSATKIAVVWDLHVAPELIADLYVDDITPDDVESWLTSQRDKRYAPGKGKKEKRKGAANRAYSAGTIKGYYGVLRQVITAACAKARLPNPCDAVEMPEPGKRKKNFLAIDEVASVLRFVEGKSTFWYPAVLLDVVSGLRWGELSALRWDDIDEAAGVIRVRRGNWKGQAIDSTKNGNDDDEPKLVPLLPAVAEVLRAHRQRMLAVQHPGLANGWIFPTEKGTLHKGSPLRKLLDAACKECKTARRITPHGLRHTANDLLRRVADGEVVRAIIGHSTPQMTHHYSHVDEGEKQLAASRVFDVIAGGKGGIKGGMTASAADSSDLPKTENPAGAGLSVGGATQI